tara:strand:+ start:1983 stop:2225 length:243 start_codon:yes stop_codon:yes gene_type:complete
MKFVDSRNEFVFKANTKVELANELYKTSWLKHDADDVNDWCYKASQRLNMVEDITLQYTYDDLDGFISELIKFNIIEEIQ